ncbi:MAG TPA: RICIN domain-containing protein, partial [Candidatus Saccharimonadales bacterium]|nr:RICIN domain-containing protein [Candidatus Saccharimonadales bacterium]
MPAQKTKKPAPKKPKSSKKAVVVSSSRPTSFGPRTLFIVLVTFALVGVVTLLLTKAATVQGPVVSAIAAKRCLDNSGNRKENSNKIQLYTCNNTAAQKWSVTDDNTIVNANGFCLDVKGAGTAPKTLVQLYKCNGTVAQKWSVKSNGSI